MSTHKKIVGPAFSMGLPKPDMTQTDPKKGDFVKHKEEFLKGIVGSTAANGARKYVEDFKTAANTWDDAFAELFAYCEENGCIACADGTYYALTAPLYIGNIDVDFENCELYNNTAESESNPACVVLTGAEKRVQKFGTVTGRQSTGILVNTANGLYKFNRLYAKLIQGYTHALCITTTNYTCCFNEFHVPLLKSSTNPLKTYCAQQNTKWVNECYFYLGAIEMYRSVIPTVLISMTNATRCNIYNVDLECGDYITPNQDHTVAVELTNCVDVAFYNPRTAEGYNAVQFRFVGESYDNFIDAEYSKYGTIDCSRMVRSDRHYNVWRGRGVTGNAGSTTNVRGFRIYGGMIVPETLTPLVRTITTSVTITDGMIPTIWAASEGFKTGGIPTLFKWAGGNITIDKRFIALLLATIQIVRTSESVGKILDTDGAVIIDGTELELGKRYNVCVDSVSYALTDAVGEFSKKYPYIADAVIVLDGGADGQPGEPGNDYILTDEDVREIAEQAAKFVEVPDVNLDGYAKTDDIPTDEHINDLINTALGVIANGSY